MTSITSTTRGFDMESFCGSVAYCDMTADDIAQTTPEVLSTLCHQDLDELLKEMQKHAPADSKSKIGCQLKVLYSMSLANSSFRKIIEELETQLPQYLKLCQRSTFSNLIMQSQRAIKESPKNSLEDAQRQLKIRNQFIQEITNLTNLFWYLDARNRKRIENLSTYLTNYYRIPLFPVCRKEFGKFCNALNQHEEDRKALVDLRKALLAQVNELQKRVFPVKSSNIPVPQGREKLFEYLAIPLWNAGSQILEISLKNSFLEKSMGRLNESLDIAIRSQLAHFPYVNPNTLLDVKLPEPFVHAVWNEFLGDRSLFVDVLDVMKVIWRYIPQTANEENEIYIASIKYLNENILGAVTFPSLKEWLEKNTKKS